MTNHALLSDPQELIGKQWSKDPSPERRLLLGLARDALRFLFATGQRERFADFHKNRAAVTPPQSYKGFERLKERINKTEYFFTKLRDESKAANDRKFSQVILDALQFISSTNQYDNFSEYLAYLEAGGPPYIVASFNTMEEADDWLKKHPHPPDFANILVGREYHSVVHDRRWDFRRLLRGRDLEYYLAELIRAEPPRAIPSFQNLQEAEAWLHSQPDSFRWAWVSIAGEVYLAAHYPNIHHRALYPLSMAEGYEVEEDDPPDT